MMGSDIPEVAIVGDAVKHLGGELVGSKIKPCLDIRVHAPQRFLERRGMGTEIDKLDHRSVERIAALLRRLTILTDAKTDRQNFRFAHGAPDCLKQGAFVHGTGKLDVMGDGRDRLVGMEGKLLPEIELRLGQGKPAAGRIDMRHLFFLELFP